MTRELFYENAYLKEFTATVTACRPAKQGFDIVLDQTAFFPEGGGQAGDRGTLTAGDVTAKVTDTRHRDGDLVHCCDKAIEPGTVVTGKLDWQWRFDLMQQHSGEHLVSGVVHGRWGYDNVGFHMGSDVITIDFDGEITWEELLEVEQAANRKVWEDLETDIFYPNAEELAALEYRSKKELTGQVRIVRFPGHDTCACCGIHVARTGEVGLIKMLSVTKFRSGVRIEMLSGRRALEAVNVQLEQNRSISQQLSAKPVQTAAAVERMHKELDQVKFDLVALQNKLAAMDAERYAGAGSVTLFADGLSGDSLRRYCLAIGETCGGRCAVFADTGAGYQYVILDNENDLRGLAKELNTALNGRGGGKPNFVQGSVQADRAAIEAFFADK